ncbi:MAG: tyrosine-protein phosphatase [Thermoanaerobaculia bacterium]
MIDLHLHLLHSTDDGAENLEQALAMASLAASDGCEVLVATPHQRRDEWETADPRRLQDRLAEIAEGVRRTGGRPELRLGAEIRVDSELLADLAARERSGILPLAGSRYLLLELDPFGVGPDPVELVRELLAEGWRPIFAHPEMIPFLWESEEEPLARLAEAGALFQITAMSVTGEFGRGAKERAWELLRAGWVQFVASDAHRPDWRPPGLARAYRTVAELLGEPAARAVTIDNPRAVLADTPLPGIPAPPAFVHVAAPGSRTN